VGCLGWLCLQEGLWVAGAPEEAACQSFSGVNTLLWNTFDLSVGAFFLKEISSI